LVKIWRERLFTSKELDTETNLYYFGARYLDPKTSRWISPDPAFGAYLPVAGGNNADLPGMGGVFNPVNINPYHYGGNNPIKYVDPNGFENYIADKANMDRLRSAGVSAQTAGITMGNRNVPMNNAGITWSFAGHQAGGSSTPGVDISSNNRTVFTSREGILIYRDSGNIGYGFHAILTYTEEKSITLENGVTVTYFVNRRETYAHLVKPENTQELLNQGPIEVEAGALVGTEGNTGNCTTTAGGAHPRALVTPEERAAGWGRHLHWDRREDGKFIDPLD